MCPTAPAPAHSPTPQPSPAGIERIRRLNTIGIALSAERDRNRLMEMILAGARELTRADGGTLYLVDPAERKLRFAIVVNDSLNTCLGGTGQPIDDRFPPIPLELADGSPNVRTVVAWAVLNERIANVANAYDEQDEGFDFSGTRAFDQRTGYRSRSFLTVPLRNHEGEVIAAMQLLNKLDDAGQPVPFDQEDQELVESLASQAAVALTNQRLIDELRTLFDSFIQVIATAIDAKSPHTGMHCRRVPDATLMLAEAANHSALPGVADFRFNEDDFYELRTAAWLHDCGKVITPHHVMEKATKLEGLCDRIGWVADRFEIARRDLQIAWLERQLEAARQGQTVPDDERLAYEAALQTLADDLAFLQKSNTGGEFMADEAVARVAAIGARTWLDASGAERPLLNADEVLNLSIRKGTLNNDERKIMEGHMVATLQMLEQLPFPRHLQRVPEYAGGHHERMDGRGYPRGLKREEMSIPARIMGIADIFEALTAHERPYKKPMSLSQALTIMGRLVDDQHLDPDLFAVFVYEKVYLQYAERHLKPEQMDEIDLAKLPGLNRLREAGLLAA